ncbi:MAG: OmpA family protein [Ignavibacteriae bacterium]|nr:OmpA family protein [Ignavibacteriota bacterium]MCB9216005.1 OmpA family protein [Ignavibacteria bacterium]
MAPRPNKRNAGKVFTLCLLVIVAQVSLLAQPDPRSIMLGLGLGTGIYHGEFNSLQGAGFSPVLSQNATLNLQYNITSSVAIGGHYMIASFPYAVTADSRALYASNFFGPAGSTTYPGSSVPITEQNDIGLTNAQVYGKWYIMQEKLSPYALLGLGVTSFNPKNENGDPLPRNITGSYSTTSFTIPMGIGFEYQVAEKWRAWLEGVYHRTFTDYLDGYANYVDYIDGLITTGPGTQPTQSDHYTAIRLGLSYRIWQHKPKPENEPLAAGDPPPPTDPSPPTGQSSPEQPAPTPPAMDKPNAPNSAFETDSEELDSDGDHLSDKAEREEYGTDPFSQDSDSDGLTDGEEVMLYNTNPLAADTDGDLLSDMSEVQRHGTSPRAVDTDQDQLTDNEELARTGTDPLSPDTDEDGVLDGVDNCPTIPGPPENDGCPVGREGIDPLIDPDLGGYPKLESGERKEFSNIYFRQNSDDLDFTRPETGENLVQLLNFLEECDDVGVLIEGHTSSEGNPDWNLKLSKLRADRVRDWLVANGVSPNKLLGTVGYGSRLPKINEPESGSNSLSAESLERVRGQNRRITALVRKPCQ